MEAKPSPGDEKLDAWEDKAEEAAGELYLALEDSQKQHVKNIEDNPVMMWATLRSVHVQQRPATRFNAYSALFNIRKAEDESLPSLITKVEAALQEIRSLATESFTLDDLYKDL